MKTFQVKSSLALHHTLKRPFINFAIKSFSALASFVLAIVLLSSSNALAVVLISDGFGDGDLDNDGIAFEDEEVAGTYEPFLDDMDMRVDSPLIFPAGTMVTGPTAGDEDDVNDVGIRWFSSGGFGSTFVGPAASSPQIINDAAGALPETNGGFFNAITGTTQTIAALDSGLALGVESKGRGRSLSGFFETDQDYSNGKQGTIELGKKVGDQIKVSFDFRVWMSNENFNATGTTNHVPDFGQLRFGLFQDTDDQLGQTNPLAGSGFTPAVWGEENGMFRGDRTGPDATGDAGWYVRVPLQDAASTADPIFDILPDGGDARINEETNDTGVDAERFLQGFDNQTVAAPDSEAPGLFNLDTRSRYNIALTLERFDEANGSTDPNVDGDNIEATLTVIDIDNPSSTWSLSGFDSLEDLTGAGFDSDSWDYFSIALAGASDSNDFDFLMDNFTVECFGSNCAAATDTEPDGDIDGADFLELQRSDSSLISQWQSDYPAGTLAAVNAVPEPASIVSLCFAGLLALGGVRRNRK